MNDGPSVGRLIRRARAERHLSQSALAKAIGVSQPMVSYYERDIVRPSGEAAKRLGFVLGMAVRIFRDVENQTLAPTGETPQQTRPARGAVLRTLEVVPGIVDFFDNPVGDDGGDIAFAVDLSSHVLMIVIDAAGAGADSVVDARIAAACAFGASIRPGGGVPAPEDVVDALNRYTRQITLSGGPAAICVVSFEHRTREIRYCRLGMPPPFLRSGRLALWTGKPEGPAGAFVGVRQSDANSLLVVATDGVAHMKTRTGRSLWEAPDMRTLLSSAERPEQVSHALRIRAKEVRGGGHRDDMLAVTVCPWRS